MKVYLSHPYGKNEENRKRAARIAAWYRRVWRKEGKAYELVNPLEELKDEESQNTEDEMLGLAVEKMRSCDAVIFASGWKRSRGCRYEHMVAFADRKKIGYLPKRFCQMFERPGA